MKRQFSDFDKSELLHLAVAAGTLWNGAERASFVGAQRLTRFKVQSMRLVDSSLPLRWGKAQLSPVLQGTGAWAQPPR